MDRGGLWKVNEIASNLLEHLLTLPVRVRSFSYLQEQAIKINFPR